jgi:hypothetical protein
MNEVKEVRSAYQYIYISTLVQKETSVRIVKCKRRKECKDQQK